MLEDFLNRIFRYLSSRNKTIQPDNHIKLQKKFSKKEDGTKKVNDYNDRKMQSMADSQGINDFSGSSYNGPGNVDHEKRNSNMSQRNF